jgi:RNA polymerase sigma factor (sigma-70 family)
MSPNKIVKGFNKEDPEAVGFVWNTYYPLVTEIIGSLTNDSPDTKDMASETLIGLLSHDEPFESLEAIRKWLVTSAKNASLNHLKHIHRAGSKSVDIAYHMEHVFPKDAADAETRGYLIQKISTAIEDLPPKCKEIFKLYHIDKLKNREIAERLGISEKAVEKQKTKAFNTLRMEIKPEVRYMFSIIFL